MSALFISHCKDLPPKKKIPDIEIGFGYPTIQLVPKELCVSAQMAWHRATYINERGAANSTRNGMCP